MSSYLNITAVGNVGRDPELRYTASGVAVCDFSLAVNKSYTKADGERVERTVWLKVTCWRQLAEIVSQYVKKGRQVMVIGSLIEADSYEGRDGNTRTSLNLTADQVIFLQGGERTDAGESRTFTPDSADLPF
jgi:single-strand DNA-binding protein